MRKARCVVPGAPVISEDGGTVGVMFGPEDNALDDGHGGTLDASRIAPQIARAAKLLRIRLQVLSAPRL